MPGVLQEITLQLPGSTSSRRLRGRPCRPGAGGLWETSLQHRKRRFRVICMKSNIIMGHIAASNRITIMTSVVHLGIIQRKEACNSLAKTHDSQQVVAVTRLVLIAAWAPYRSPRWPAYRATTMERPQRVLRKARYWWTTHRNQIRNVFSCNLSPKLMAVWLSLPH